MRITSDERFRDASRSSLSAVSFKINPILDLPFPYWFAPHIINTPTSCWAEPSVGLGVLVGLAVGGSVVAQATALGYWSVLVYWLALP